MNWNFNFSIITALVLCLLLVYYFVKPRLPVILNSFFLALLLMEIATLVADVGSSIMDMRYEQYPVWALYLANTLFFMCFIVRSFVFFGYTMTLLQLTRQNTHGFSVVYYLVEFGLLLVTASSFLSGAVFSIDPEAGYVRGPLYGLVYVALFFYLIMGMLYLLFYGKKLEPMGFVSIFSAHLLLMVGGVLRYVLPELLVMNSFFMLAIMILFLSFENADIYSEKRTKSFNYQAFERVIQERIAYGKRFWVAAVMARNYSETREIYGGVQMDQALGMVGDYLKRTFKHKVVFYERNGCFIIMDKNGKDRDMIRRKVTERFDRHWQAAGTMVDIHMVYAEMDPELTPDSPQQLGECLRRLFDNVSTERELDLQRMLNAGITDSGFVINQSMLDAIVSEFKDRKVLKDAIEEKRVMAYMQPLVDAKTGKIVGAEALARIEDPELGLIPPFRFIPIAEKNGSIGLLGEQVFERVCEFISRYGKQLPLQFVNVNLSPIQCMNRELADRFEQLIEKYNVDPERIHLEITEESLVDMKILHWQMDRLIDRGFSFALDDFGSGYANQFRVKEYPFSGVKLDMGIVRDYFREPDRMLPDSVNTFLDRGLSITAEGIETKEMAEGMRDMGVTYLQGYYFSKPLPIDDFVRYVEKRMVEEKNKRGEE